MKESWNELLVKQIREYLNNQSLPSTFKPLFDAISQTYEDHKRETTFLNRAADISSDELFQANVELRLRNEELDRLVYSTSHDLRAPLTSIIGLLRLIEDTEDDNDKKHYLSQIKTSAESLDNFIKSIVQYTHNKKSHPKYERINFDKIIKECINHLDFMPHADKVSKKITIDEDGTFYSDPQRLFNVFSNLISNSIKYFDPQKSKPSLDIKVACNFLQAEIIISDNGLGIKKEYLPRVFEMFYRASVRSKGSGIGLYIVKEILDKLGGSIKVNSELDEWTEFKILIPNQKNA